MVNESTTIPSFHRGILKSTAITHEPSATQLVGRGFKRTSGPAQHQPPSLLPEGGSLVTPILGQLLIIFDQQTFIAHSSIRGLI